MSSCRNWEHTAGKAQEQPVSGQTWSISDRRSTGDVQHGRTAGRLEPSEGSSDGTRQQTGCHDVVNMQYASGTTGFRKGDAESPQHHQQRLFNRVHMKFTQGQVLCLRSAVSLFRDRAGNHVLPHPRSTLVMVERFDPLLVLARPQGAVPSSMACRPCLSPN